MGSTAVSDRPERCVRGASMKWTVAIVAACFFAVVLASCATNDSQRGAVSQAEDREAAGPDSAPTLKRLLENPTAFRLLDRRPPVLIQRQLFACWTPPVGAGTNVTATVRFSLNRDGSLAGVPTLVKTTTGAQSQAFAESALLAVRRCAPFKLPADKYESW